MTSPNLPGENSAIQVKHLGFVEIPTCFVRINRRCIPVRTE
jgi:hypothetical protein